MSYLGNDSTRIKKVVIRYYNLKELMDIYGFSYYVMNKKLERHKETIGEPDGYSYDPDQVALIFKLVKLPPNVVIIDPKARH